MIYKSFLIEDDKVSIKTASYLPETGIRETHVVINIDPSFDIENQKSFQNKISATLLRENVIESPYPVWSRYFMSDPVNQAGFFDQEIKDSVVGQAPLNGSKIGVWLYFVDDIEIHESEDTLIFAHSSYAHIIHTGFHDASGTEYNQTESIFKKLLDYYSVRNMSMSSNLVRTWIFVQGIDLHYQGMVDCRKKIFEQNGLTQETHYVASTGIEGRYFIPQVLVFMDIYSIEGLNDGQIKYLKATEYLSSTTKYGVTFERGTTIDYGDRRHIFISGTASIDKYGDIVFPANVKLQAERTIENINALLKEAGATFNDVTHLIIYLRDSGDYKAINDYMESRYSDIPKIIVWAPVCRPGWLIEMECTAIMDIKNPSYADF